MDQDSVTVLTGKPGAGTTILNRVLGEQHGRKYAVIRQCIPFTRYRERTRGRRRAGSLEIMEGLMERKRRFDAILSCPQSQGI